MISTSQTKVVKYDAMCRAIDAALKVDEVKDIRDKAVALQVYARQAKNVEAERRACEIRLRAEKKAGKLLAKMEKAKGGGTGANKYRAAGNKKQPAANSLSELGISKKQSSDWQRIAEVPNDLFERELANGARSSGQIIAATKPPPKVPAPPTDSLWLWGRLMDFRREGILDKDPNKVIAKMTDGMQTEVHEFVPKLVSWLKKVSK